MKNAKVADWDALEPLTPAYALVANVDLVVIRSPSEEEASVLYGRCLHRGCAPILGLLEGCRKRRRSHVGGGGTAGGRSRVE